MPTAGFRSCRPMEDNMMDRLVNLALHAVIMAMISGASAGALICAHWSVLRFLSGRISDAGEYVIGAAGLSLAAFFLIRNRNDLVDR